MKKTELLNEIENMKARSAWDRGVKEYEYGCGVVYRRPDGKMIISTGFPGDFCMI